MKKSRKPRVKVLRYNSTLVLRGPVPEHIHRSLCEALTYTRKTHLRGFASKLARAHLRLEPVECFVHESDPDGILPPQMLIPIGYFDIVIKELHKGGIRPVVINKWDWGHGGRLKPYWSRMKNKEWRYRQQEILQKMLDEPFGRFSCPPGYGKSWLIGQFCTLVPKARIDITTTSADVIRQLYEYLRFLGLPSVGIVGAGKRLTGERIMCYCGKSLHHSDKKADVLIADELHEFGTDQYLEQLSQYSNSRRFGFSASHDLRPDGSDFELLGLFGPIIFELDYPTAVKHGCVVPMEVVWNSVAIPNPVSGSDDILDRERYGLWRNQKRNMVIAQRARAYKNDQVLVVVSKVEHAMFLKRYLPEFTLCHGEIEKDERRWYINEGLIPKTHPSMTLERRLMLTRAFRDGKLKKVIATGVWNRGVDFRRLGVLVRADGQASPIADMQIPGRLSRTACELGKEVGILEDFLDQFDAALRSRAGRRKSNYKGYGWIQHMPSRRSMSATEQSYLFA